MKYGCKININRDCQYCGEYVKYVRFYCFDNGGCPFDDCVYVENGTSEKYMQKDENIMKITCPKCGHPIVVNYLGRKSLNIPVKNVYDAVQAHSTVTAAAEFLGCSRGYVYKVLNTAK